MRKNKYHNDDGHLIRKRGGEVGCVGAYSDVSKVQKVLFFRQHFDKHDEISAWLKFQPNRTSLRGGPRPFCVTK